MKAIIDTCIIVDALQSREPFCKDAQQIFLLAADKKFEGILTAKALTDIYYLSHKLTHDNAMTRTIINKLLKIFHLADTASIDCHQALLSDISDFEDAVMIETAKRIKANCIVTRNVKDYSKSPVKIYQPAEFIGNLVKKC